MNLINNHFLWYQYDGKILSQLTYSPKINKNLLHMIKGFDQNDNIWNANQLHVTSMLYF